MNPVSLPMRPVGIVLYATEYRFVGLLSTLWVNPDGNIANILGLGVSECVAHVYLLLGLKLTEGETIYMSFLGTGLWKAMLEP